MQNNYEESKINYTKTLEKNISKNYKRLWAYFQKILPKIEKEILIKKEKSRIKILDIGCGVGYGLAFFASQNYKKLFGIDINRYSLKIAKERCPKANVRYGDVIKIPFQSNEFDLVILTEVIEHLDDPQTALEEIRRILNPGGILFLTTPNRMGLMGLSNGPIKFFTDGYYYKSVLRILGKLTCGPEHPKEYFAFELAKMLEKQHFKVLHFPKFCYLPLFPAGKYYLIAQKITV